MTGRHGSITVFAVVEFHPKPQSGVKMSDFVEIEGFINKQAEAEVVPGSSSVKLS